MHEQAIAPYRMIVSMLLMFCLLVSAFTSVRPILIVGVVFRGGILVSPLIYSLLALIVEVYGLPTARRHIEIAVGCLALTALTVELIVHLPYGTLDSRDAAAFDALYEAAPTPLIISVLSLAGASVLTMLLMVWIARHTRGRLLFLRLCGAPLIASSVAVVIGIPLTLYPAAPPATVAMLVFDRVAFSVIYYVVTMPLLWAVIILIRTHETPRPYPDVRYPDDLRKRASHE